MKALPALVCGAVLFATAQGASWKFDFGAEKSAPVYSKERGSGFDLGSKVAFVEHGGRGFCTSAQPFYFSVDLPEGNYRVAVTFGDAAGESVTTVKAESRRLMLERVATAAGELATRTFTVNIRTPRIAGGGAVRLKEREKSYLHWDEKLTLEFSGAHPCVGAVEITRDDDAVTVFLIGDSTVTDQPNEPWNSWGQMLPRFFQPGVAVANHAESGESLKSTLGAHRLAKVLSAMRPGDTLFIQFGHNDQKDKSADGAAFAGYADRLRQCIAGAREHGGLPVLVTSMQRRTFDDTGAVTNSLGDFPEAMRTVARETQTPLIDLHAMSKLFYETLGPEGSGKAFVDHTHHNNYGSYELARCIVEGIKAARLPLTKFLVDDLPAFDPAHPDPVEKFAVPASPPAPLVKPDGN